MSILDHPKHPCESTGSGDTHAYTIEVRMGRETSRELRIGKQRVTTNWTQLDPDMVPEGQGVPNGRSYVSAALQMSSLLDYSTAEALRWWAVAVAQSHHANLETRLVRHELSWSWRSRPIEAVKTVEGRDLMHPHAEPKPKEVTLSNQDLLNILEQRKGECVRKQEYDKGAQWREVQRALMTAADINDATPTEQ
jgi:hypothetical protein